MKLFKVCILSAIHTSIQNSFSLLTSTSPVQQQSNMIECCRNDSVTGLCFEYLEPSDNPLELPQYSCLRVRSVVDQFQKLCQSSNDCDKLHCFRPLIAEKMKLFVFTRRNLEKALFLGLPAEIHSPVFVSEYIQTTYFSAAIPNTILKFCNFLIMFSGALAAVNLMPCFYFDGQLITDDLVFLYLRRNADFDRKTDLCFVLLSTVPHHSFSHATTVIGTCILVVYTALALVTSFTD